VTEYVWADVRQRAIRRFHGELPHADTEAAILDVFERHPQRVVETIDHVARQGKARSFWAVSLAELKRVDYTGRVTVSERAQRIAQAEEWIRHAGLHFDREDEVVDELFVRGRLSPYAEDESLRERLIDLWRSTQSITTTPPSAARKENR
jgi:hypothetical protein